jgi:hypothetical protein
VAVVGRWRLLDGGGCRIVTFFPRLLLNTRLKPILVAVVGRWRLLDGGSRRAMAVVVRYRRKEQVLTIFYK